MYTKLQVVHFAQNLQKRLPCRTVNTKLPLHERIASRPSSLGFSLSVSSINISHLTPLRWTTPLRALFLAVFLNLNWTDRTGSRSSVRSELFFKIGRLKIRSNPVWSRKNRKNRFNQRFFFKKGQTFSILCFDP